jgi:hypothetical protein
MGMVWNAVNQQGCVEPFLESQFAARECTRTEEIKETENGT